MHSSVGTSGALTGTRWNPQFRARDCNLLRQERSKEEPRFQLLLALSGECLNQRCRPKPNCSCYGDTFLAELCLFESRPSPEFMQMRVPTTYMSRRLLQSFRQLSARHWHTCSSAPLFANVT